MTRPVHGGANTAELRSLGIRPDDVLDFSANVNPLGAAPGDRLQAGLPLPQAFDGPGDRVVVDFDGRLAQGEGGVVARVHRRDRLEQRREGQRFPVVDLDVADLRHGDRLQVVLRDQLVDRGGNQVPGDVVQDPIAEMRPHDPHGRLPGPKSLDLRRPAVAPGDAADGRVDRGGRNLGGQLLAARSDVPDVRFHRRRHLVPRPVDVRPDAGPESRAPGWCERGDSNPHSLAATGS